MPHPTFIRNLGGELILRRATPEDRDALVRFNAITHSDSDEPDRYVAGHTDDLISGRLPGFQAGDFTIVEDTRTGQIVSSLSLIPQVWAYEGIPFPVGRPEIVGTAPAYRRRGLVRAQFAEVHQWSQERGDLVQVITGNPWYYRQFGYELALTLGGGRMGYGPNIPRLKPGETEPYQIRSACADDLPLIARMYDRAMERQPIHCLRSEDLWRYEWDGRGEYNLNRKTLHVIERTDGPESAPARVGFFALTPWLWGPNIWLSAYEIDAAASAAASWLEITPAVLRCLWSVGEAYARREGKSLEMFALGLGAEHPAYDLFSDCLPVVRKPGAWYIRVADLPAFLRRIAPALEKRLACSALAGYIGRLRISFYRGGIALSLSEGRLEQVEAWLPTQEEWGDAAFPELTFYQLLFGYRSVEDLEYAFADCWVDDRRTASVLNALFPKRPSDIWGVG
jgi:hypothetical protein